MAPLTSTVDTGIVGDAAEALSYFGIPNLFDWLSEGDGDPEDIEERTQAFVDASETMDEVSNDISQGREGVNWDAQSAMNFQDVLEGIWEGFKAVVEFVLYIPELVLQILDWILDLFRLILNIIIFVITAITTIFIALVLLIAFLSATVFGSGGIPGAIGTAFKAAWSAKGLGWMGVIGGVSLISAALSLIIKCLDWVVEALVDVLQDWRDGLGGRLPDLPDWDPDMPGFSV